MKAHLTWSHRCWSEWSDTTIKNAGLKQLSCPSFFYWMAFVTFLILLIWAEHWNGLVLYQGKKSKLWWLIAVFCSPFKKPVMSASHILVNVWYLLCLFYGNTRDASKFLECQKCRLWFFLLKHFRQKTPDNAREQKVDWHLWECLSVLCTAWIGNIARGDKTNENWSWLL